MTIHQPSATTPEEPTFLMWRRATYTPQLLKKSLSIRELPTETERRSPAHHNWKGSPTPQLEESTTKITHKPHTKSQEMSPTVTREIPLTAAKEGLQPQVENLMHPATDCHCHWKGSTLHN